MGVVVVPQRPLLILRGRNSFDKGMLFPAGPRHERAGVPEPVEPSERIQMYDLNQLPSQRVMFGRYFPLFRLISTIRAGRAEFFNVMGHQTDNVRMTQDHMRANDQYLVACRARYTKIERGCVVV